MKAAYQRNGEPVTAEAFYAIACDPRRSVAVEACAGAGKTWMLVSRIVRALLESPPGELRPQEILAITFTKKAAGEMRERLDQWLKEFAHADDATLRHELAIRGVLLAAENEKNNGFSSKIGRTPKQNMPEALSNLYRSVLATGRSVQIRTFHSWFAALLRNAPVAVLQRLNLPVNYTLLEDDAPARAMVWRRFYTALLADDALKADYEAVVLAHGRFQTEKALGAALDKRVEFAMADALGVVDASVVPFGQLFPALADFGVPTDSLATPQARQRWLARAAQLSAEKNKTPQKAAQLVRQAFETDDLMRRCDMLRRAFFVADEDRLTHNLLKFPAALDAEPELLTLFLARGQYDAFNYQQRMARLARLLLAEFGALKHARQWVDMNDVERAAQTMLSDPVLSGWVQERLDARIKHLMVDEFQDTNPLQWQALSSWLSGYGGAGSSAPSVFLVGDPKQSIYRFRRAEPQVFIAAQAFVVATLGGDLLACDHTRRNAVGVIDTVNTVMAAATANDGYQGFRLHTTASSEPGSLGCLPQIPRGTSADTDGDDDLPAVDSDGVWRDSLSTPRELPEETLRSLEARQAAAWIARVVTGGPDQPGLAPGQIMALSRKRASLVPLRDALEALHIPAQIGEKTELIDCCEVQDIVALLDVLVSPQHDLSLARALRSPLFSVSDDDLVALALLRRTNPLPWFELLQLTDAVPPTLQGVSAILLRWKAWLAQLPPHDAMQAIYDDGDVLARFGAAAPDGQRAAVLGNLRALLGAALALDGGRFATPYGLVRALKAGGLLAPLTLQADAVRLLTIHGAKGLEAEAVLLLDTDTVPRNADTMTVLVDWPGQSAAPEKFVFLVSEKHPPICAEALLAQEQLARGREELNALYVAMTRAKSTLVISSVAPHRETTDSWWQRLQPLTTPLSVVPAPHESVAVADTGETAAAFSLSVLPRFTSASSSASPAKPLAESPLNARIGKAMHRLLEWGAVTGAVSGAALVPSVLAVQAAAQEFALSPAQAQVAVALAQRIACGAGAWAWHPDVVGWQGNEVDMVYRGQAFRLDRLVQRKDASHAGHWWVLDYKSAPEPQRQPALVAKMQLYRQAVQQAYPGAVVKAAFLTGQGDIVEVAEGMEGVEV